MRHGYSPALRHIKRTHGVCLRWLAERFRDLRCNLFYERSALQAADIYTKAFTIPAEWDKALRLINVLHPARFWDGARADLHGQMGSQHKGGVEFSYCTPNPWHGRESRSIPRPPADAAAAACRTRSSPGSALSEPTPPETHTPWVSLASLSKRTAASARPLVGKQDRDHDLGE